MNLNNLTDTALLNNTKSLVSNERELLTQILHHLREVDRRKLFAALKYKSLFEYAVKELGYSEDSAYRRINAMRLLNELPQIEAKLNTGALTLSNISAATQVFRAEVKTQGESRSLDDKLSLLKAIENKSKREAEEIAQSLSHAPKEMLKPEFIKPQGEEHIEVRFTAKKSLEVKIQRLKGLLAHSHPNISTAELFEKLCDEFITLKEKRMASQNQISQGGASDNSTRKSVVRPQKPVRHEGLRQMPEQLTTQTKDNAIKKRYIPTHIKRFIWARDKAKCSNCGSQYAIELDHIKPLAQNGPSTAENLRLLCRACNQRSAIEVFGIKKMMNYQRNTT